MRATQRERDRLLERLRRPSPVRADPSRLLVVVALLITATINVVLVATGKMHRVYGRSTPEATSDRSER